MTYIVLWVKWNVISGESPIGIIYSPYTGKMIVC